MNIVMRFCYLETLLMEQLFFFGKVAPHLNLNSIDKISSTQQT